MRRSILAWGPAVTWALVLFALSSFSLMPNSVWAAVNDKLVHLVLYGILGLTLAWGKEWNLSRLPDGVVIALGLVYAAADEWHQAFVPHRFPDVADFVADSAGVVIGYLVLVLPWRMARRSLRSARRSGGDARKSDEGGSMVEEIDGT